MNPGAVALARFWVKLLTENILLGFEISAEKTCTTFFEDGSRILRIFDVCQLKLTTALNSRGITAVPSLQLYLITALAARLQFRGARC